MSGTWEDRLRQEHDELAERRQKLDIFLDTDRFELLADKDCELLLEQHAAMTHYLNVLYQRIERMS